MADKNFKVKNGIDIGDSISIADDATITGITTDNLDQGSTNQYYATSLFDADFDTKTTDDLTEGGTNRYYATSLFDADFGSKTTDDLTEGSNLYYLDSRARSALSAGTNITYDSGTGVISVVSQPDFQNTIMGNVRSSSASSAGNIWNYLNNNGIFPTRGVSIDNSDDTTKRAGLIIRNYNAATTGSQTTRSSIQFENSRGTPGSESGLLTGDTLFDLFAYGRTTTGWSSDQFASPLAHFSFQMSQDLNVALSPDTAGTKFVINTMPKNTNLANGGGTLVKNIEWESGGGFLRSDDITLGQANSNRSSFTASISGTTLTVTSAAPGTIKAGQFIITTANISGGVEILPGTRILSQLTGTTGGVGTYQLNTSQTITSTGFYGYQGLLNANKSALTTFTDTIYLNSANNGPLKGGQIEYRRTHGCFHKTAAVTAAASNTVYNFDWTSNVTTHHNDGITISNTSHIDFDDTNTYNVQCQFQARNSANALVECWVWLAKNGTDIAETGTMLSLRPKGSSTYSYQQLNSEWLIDVSAGDYIEVRFAVSDAASASIEYTAANTLGFTHPSIPSAILTVQPMGA